MSLVFPIKTGRPQGPQPVLLTPLKSRLIQPSFGYPRRRAAVGGGFIDILTRLGLTTDLKLCLDLGDANCYGGSGQTLTDLSTINTDFWFGADSGASTDDPAFKGTAGDLSASEYLSVDGGDFCRVKSNPAWAQTLHKNNALFSAYIVYYVVGSNGTRFIGTGNAGISFSWDMKGGFANQGVAVYNTTVQLDKISTLGANSAAWNHFGITIDEAAGAGGSLFWHDGSNETFDGTYTSPSAGSYTGNLELFSLGSATNLSPSGDRLALLAIWQGTGLTAADFSAIRDEVQKARF